MKLSKPNRNRNMNRKPLFNMYWMYGLIALSLLALYYFQDGSQTKDVNWSEFEKAALAGDVDKIMIFSQNGIAEGFLTEQGAKNQNFDMSPQMTGEKKSKLRFPPPTRFRTKSMLGMTNSPLKANLR